MATSRSILVGITADERRLATVDIVNPIESNENFGIDRAEHAKSSGGILVQKEK